jgi:hypothetical protein
MDSAAPPSKTILLWTMTQPKALAYGGLAAGSEPRPLQAAVYRSPYRSPQALSDLLPSLWRSCSTRLRNSRVRLTGQEQRSLTSVRDSLARVGLFGAVFASGLESHAMLRFNASVRLMILGGGDRTRRCHRSLRLHFHQLAQGVLIALSIALRVELRDRSSDLLSKDSLTQRPKKRPNVINLYLVPFLTFFFGLFDRSVRVRGVAFSRDLSHEHGLRIVLRIARHVPHLPGGVDRRCPRLTCPLHQAQWPLRKTTCSAGGRTGSSEGR